MNTKTKTFNCVAMMPLRGGSKSIPLKNIKKIAGRPLFYWGLKSAIDSKQFDRVYVSTDDARIKEAVAHWLPEVTVIDRPAELATDKATTESVMLHFAEQVDFNVVCLIQATSPLTVADDFQEAVDQFSDEALDSLVTGVEWKRFFWTKDGKAVNYDPLNRPMRQNFDGWIMENGAFYLTKKSILLEHKCRLGGKIGVHIMDDMNALEIDEPSDWLIIEKMLEEIMPEKILAEKAGGQSSASGADFSKTKALVVDVDGTLTDGGMYYSDSGEMLKKYNTKDAQGMKKLEQAGIKIAVITAEDSPRVHSRIQKLQFEHYHCGVKDKLPVLKQLCEEWGISLDEVAYVGDDWGDIDCLKASGIGAAPADCEEIVKPVLNYICRRKGGDGAVREVCDNIFNSFQLDTNSSLNK